MSTPQRPIPVSIGRPQREGVPAEAPARASVSEPSEARPTSAQAFVQTPLIDIFEEPDGLVLLADLPGAVEESVAIDLEDNLLTLRAEARRSVPESAPALLEEFPFGCYQRTFILSDEVDRSRISAELKHGVLRISLPKAERAKPRRIEIKGLDGNGPAS
ncbi:Hsp20/alpha crystallin family protein [Tautonia rosea]|uniref:Hsp20/alpha crystallin family protein n=1 Tax=Tautonia rosea TaxID=2728037 RepID=UPI00147324C4|nr:Hsp20/alpha crystallin family protein [Tautonia rosea]